MKAVVAGAVLLLCATLQASHFESRPIDFVENPGQWDSPARFVAWNRSTFATFEPDAITLRNRDEQISLVFENAQRGATLTGENKRTGYYNFFLGNDRTRWCSRVPAYGSVLYREMYEGIDVRVREGFSTPLEYDLILDPHADLDQVVIRVDGSSALQLNHDGSLTIHTAAGSIRQTAPRTWEVLRDGQQRPVTSHVRLIDERRFGFVASERNPNLAMVIDPGLEWSTFLGGNDREELSGGVAATTDGTGDIIVAGKTWSSDFPATSGGKGASPLIPFVARFNSTGSTLKYATLFGGTDGNVAHLYDLTLDSSSAPILVGETNSANFPTTPGAYDPTFNEPSAEINRGWDAFITRFDAGGSHMVFSTFLGAAPIFDSSKAGSKRGGDEAARAVAMSPDGSVFVGGWTKSEDFPTTVGAYDRTHEFIIVPTELNGVPGEMEARTDAFLARFSADGSRLLYSTYLGGQADDVIWDLVVDSAGFVTVGGVQAPIETADGAGGRKQHGTPFPTTDDAWAKTHLGASDAIIARLKLDGQGAADLKYSTIIGGTWVEEIFGVALDPNNAERIAFSGTSRSWNFPTTVGTWKRTPTFMSDGNPYYFGFVMQFRFPAAGGGSLRWSTLIEAMGAQVVEDVAIDESGDVIVIGTDEAGVPTTERSWKRFPWGVFISRFSGDGKQLLYSTFIHQSSTIFHDFLRIATAGPRVVFAGGSTLKTDFPTTAGAFDRVYGTDGTTDGFHRMDSWVAKLQLEENGSADTTADAPTLLSPADGAAFPASPGESIIAFDWTDVADPSGVHRYQVALASNPEFLLGFGGRMPGYVTESQWETWFSGDGTYYWRVRTLDGANNFSPWSETRRFTIGNVNWTNFCAVALTPEAVFGGSTSQGRLYVINTAQAGGITYTLTSSDPTVATVPPSVTVPAGSNTATFTVTSKNVTKSTPVQITVWAEGNGDHPVLWVDPAPVDQLMLSSITLDLTSVTGGNNSKGTATLNGPAPDEGAAVTLSSSNTEVATVPPSVTVAAGATTANFTVTTKAVSSTTTVDITGAYGGATRTATLTVNPPPIPGTPTLLSPPDDAKPPQPITFDWTDVNGAASYTIVIDDEDKFAAPHVVNKSVTTSQATIGDLPARRLWWRVRGVNSVGNAGNWSAVRRVEPQAPSPAPPPPPPPPGDSPLPAPSLLNPPADARFSPGQMINFDWSDVSGAANYTIQIDDDDKFSSPHLRNETVTNSNYSTSTLPTRTMWWRVRANSSNGTAGNWSSIRRFEVKD